MCYCSGCYVEMLCKAQDNVLRIYVKYGMKRNIAYDKVYVTICLYGFETLSWCLRTHFLVCVWYGMGNAWTLAIIA